MAKFIGSTGHSVLVYLPHFLALSSFGILLGAVAALQQRCGQAGANRLFGATSYLAAVSCDKLFSFDWWILFWQGFVVFVLFFFIVSRQLHKWRAGASGVLTVAALLLMFQTNTFYHIWSGTGIPNVDSTFNKRAKVAFAGALVGAVADLLLIIMIGLHDEKATPEERTGARAEEPMMTYVPLAAPIAPTPAPAVRTTESETVTYQAGRIGSHPA